MTAKPKIKVSSPTAGPPRNTSQQRWASQAAQEAMLRYGPQESVLSQLYTDAQNTYAQKADAAKAFQGLQARTIDQVSGSNQAAFDQAQSRQQAIDSRLQGDLQGITDPAAAPAKAAALGGVKLGQSVDNSEQLSNQLDLGRQKVQGVDSARFQTRGAQDDLTTAITKILAQKQDLASQAGTFSALTYQQLHDAAAKLASASTIAKGHDTAGIDKALIGQGLDPLTGKPLPGSKTANKNKGKVSATGVPLLPGGEHNAARKSFAQALAALQSHPPSRAVPAAQIIAKLTAGSTGSAVFDTVKSGNSTKQQRRLNPDGTPVSTPTVKPVDPLLATAAVEQFRSGHISGRTQKALADAGYSIKRLGLITKHQFGLMSASAKLTTPQHTLPGLNIAAGLG